MNYTEIAAAAGQEVADRIQDDDYINSFVLPRLVEQKATDIDDLTRGAVILGVEPIAYPLTDGLYIYLKQPAGNIILLTVDNDAAVTTSAGSSETLLLQTAVIKKGPLPNAKPCQKCGGAAIIKNRPQQNKKDRVWLYWAECEKCGARTRDFIDKNPPSAGTSGEYFSLMAWNSGYYTEQTDGGKERQ